MLKSPLISLIAAASENGVIGKNNQLPWHLPDDFQYFKDQTLNKPIIMGRKTFESMGKPLPKRQNIVISRDEKFFSAHSPSTDVFCAKTLTQAILLAGNVPEIIIIGGGVIYEQALPMADRIYLTRVHHVVEGDVFFPELDLTQWSVIKETYHPADEKNVYACTYFIYERLLMSEAS